MLKTCPICGTPFIGQSNTKYCSDECRKTGQELKRKAWEKRTNYNDRMRIKAQEKRAAQREEEQAEQDRKRKEQAEQAEAELAKKRELRQKQLDEDAARGDYFAMMRIAFNNGDKIRFWEAFKQREIEAAERRGEISKTTVNYIPVCEDDFVDRVIASIKYAKKIIIFRA